jgi:hypothetical protein
MINIDMEVAKNIWRDKIRAARAPILASLDVDYQRADESNDAARKTEVVASKQALRDATADPRIAAATSVENLRAAWPSALGAAP